MYPSYIYTYNASTLWHRYLIVEKTNASPVGLENINKSSPPNSPVRKL